MRCNSAPAGVARAWHLQHAPVVHARACVAHLLHSGTSHVSTLVQQCGPALCSHMQQHGPIAKWPYHYPYDTASLLLCNIHPFLLLLHCRHCQYYPRSLCTSNLHPHSYCYFHCLHLGFIFRFLFPRIIFSLWLVSCIWTFPYHFTFFFFNPLFVTLLLLLFFL